MGQRTKTCEQCGEEFGEGVGPIRLVKRRYCSLACYRLAKMQTRATKLQTRATKLCELCGAEFGEALSPSQFAKRRYCSLACACNAKYIRLTKTCKTCGERFGRREGEKASRYRERTVCCHRHRHYDVFGVRMNIQELELLTGVCKSTLYKRYSNGRDLLTGKARRV